ncbi:unnamed protein product [Peronospora effusa]|nr:unnamed protein product [Peronospora effusa]
MELIVADPVHACSEGPNLPQHSVRGKIMLVQRGDCDFEAKAQNAATWGALGLIIVNTEDDDLVMVMGGTDESTENTTVEVLDIPVVMVPQRLGECIELTVRHHTHNIDSARRSRGIVDGGSFPRIDGTAGNMKVYGPSWGMDLATIGVDKEKSRREDDEYRQESFSIAIIATPP